jgi:lipopolysaccharide/colanic/teichoic acid biosynthesis glycosyltransferase
VSATHVAGVAAAATRVGVARRTLDIVVSVLVLVASMPVLGSIALALKLSGGGPVLFRQERVGEGGRLFTIYKFRTMGVGARGSDFAAPGDPRVTRLGAVLRARHLDELPQFANVLFGQMTLVGPRPETLALASRYPPDCRAILAFRPGLTGPCQLHMRRPHIPPGRDPEEYYLSELVPQRVRLDLVYVDSSTLRHTLTLLVRTVAVVLGLRHVDS